MPSKKFGSNLVSETAVMERPDLSSPDLYSLNEKSRLYGMESGSGEILKPFYSEDIFKDDLSKQSRKQSWEDMKKYQWHYL